MVMLLQYVLSTPPFSFNHNLKLIFVVRDGISLLFLLHIKKKLIFARRVTIYCKTSYITPKTVLVLKLNKMMATWPISKPWRNLKFLVKIIIAGLNIFR